MTHFLTPTATHPPHSLLFHPSLSLVYAFLSAEFVLNAKHISTRCGVLHITYHTQSTVLSSPMAIASILLLFYTLWAEVAFVCSMRMYDGTCLPSSLVSHSCVCVLCITFCIIVVIITIGCSAFIAIPGINDNVSSTTECDRMTYWFILFVISMNSIHRFNGIDIHTHTHTCERLYDFRVTQTETP